MKILHVVVPDNFFLQIIILGHYFANFTNCFRTTILQIVVSDEVVANFAYYCSRSVWLGRRGGQSSQVGLGGQGGEEVRLVRVVW